MFLEKGRMLHLEKMFHTLLPPSFLYWPNEIASATCCLLCACFFSNAGKEPGSFRFPVPAWRPAAPEFWSRIPRSLPVLPQKAGSPDRIPGSLPETSGRKKISTLQPIREGVVSYFLPWKLIHAPLSTSRVFVVEKCFRHYAGIKECQGDGCPFPIPASVRSPGREQGCPGFRNTHGSLHGASCDNTLPGRSPSTGSAVSSVRI